MNKPAWTIQMVGLVVASVICLPTHATDTEAVEARIERLQSGLMPAILIKDEELVRKSIATRMEELKVHGVGIAIINDGALEWAGGFGMADVNEGREVDERTMFQAASISKPVAAMAALELMERDQLSLDDDINNYLSSWHLPSNEFTEQERVTLRRLMTHTAGMSVHGFGGYSFEEQIPGTVGVLNGEGNSDPIRVDTIPGTLWRYSGGGYTVMQLAMQDVSRMPFRTILDQAVLWPLNMANSTYAQPLPIRFHSHAATGYRGDGTAIEGRWHTYPEWAAAGLWTTPSDLSRWLMALQKARQGATHPVLESETVAAMLTPGMGDWGLGPVIEGEGTRFGHGGSNEGYRSIATAFLDQGQGAVVMTNSDTGTALAEEIIMTIAEIYGWPNPSPVVKTIVPLAEEEFLTFAGTYRNNYGDITFAYGDNSLQATSDIMAGATMVFRPESADTFFRTDGGWTVTFDTNNEGDAIVVVNDSIVFVEVTE